MNRVTWVLETGAFADEQRALRDAVTAAGHDILIWDDEWWSSGRWPRLTSPAVFHGSLGNAARIRDELPWRPGAYCNTAAFHCTVWYPAARRWLLHRDWSISSARALVDDPDEALRSLGHPDAVFVRPDSPLKPFSGRVVRRDALTLAALDHGFYYDDDTIAVVVAPVRSIEREWRYVIVAGDVIAGSAYAADGRHALPDQPAAPAWQFAAEVAAALPAPDEVYVMDVCLADGDLRLLELNPFSGADLYACSPSAIVTAVSALAAR